MVSHLHRQRSASWYPSFSRFYSYLSLRRVDRFGFNYDVDSIIALLHISFSLFLIGLLVCLFSLNSTVANTTLDIMLTFLAGYLALNFFPFLSHDCPYRTLLTPVFRSLHKIMLARAVKILQLLSPELLDADYPAYDIRSAIFQYFEQANKGRQRMLARCSGIAPMVRALQRPDCVLPQVANSLNENDETSFSFFFRPVLPLAPSED
jgi:hypothetical protein